VKQTKYQACPNVLSMIIDNSSIKLMLVEDLDSLRESFASTLRNDYGFDVVCDAPNGKRAIQLLSQYKPGIVLLDVQMPTMNGFETLKIIKEQYSGIKVIMFTAYPGYLLSRERILRGADAVVLKSANIKELVSVIQKVSVQGYAEPVLPEKASPEIKASLAGQDLRISLTPTETKVLQLICQSRTNKEISEALKMSVRTVEFHRTNIYKKVNTSSLIEVYKYAIQLGIAML
jgi:two-component system response regulator DegU